MLDGVFAETVWSAAQKVGMSPPKVADDIVRDLFPETHKAAQGEGANAIFRDGLIRKVKGVLSAKPDDENQTSFDQIDPRFAPMVSNLKRGAYHVESTGGLVTIPDLIRDVQKLDEARRYMRKKGQECLVEAGALDKLYEAVIASSSSNDNHAAREAA